MVGIGERWPARLPVYHISNVGMFFSPELFSTQPELSERSLQMTCCRGGSDLFQVESCRVDVSEDLSLSLPY